MSDRDNPATLLESAVLLAAKLLADELDVEQLLRGEEHVPHRMIRRMRRHKVLQEAAQIAWESAGRELLHKLLAQQGMDLDVLGMNLDEFADTFQVGFISQLSARMDEHSEILQLLQWRHVGARPRQVNVAVPPNTGGPVSSYALDFAGSREDSSEGARAGRGHGEGDTGDIVYVAATGKNDFGVSWHWTGSAWQPGNRIALALPDKPAQPFTGFYDAARGGMACWTMLRHEENTSRAFGVLVRDSGAEAIEQHGDIPVGPWDCAFDFGVIMGRDPVRQTTVALGRTVLWELDNHGQWTRAAAVPEQCTSKYWFKGNAGAVYDPQGKRVIFHWIDWDNVELRLRSWDGTRLDDVPHHGLPERMRASRGVALCSHRQHGAVLFAGKNGQLFALRDHEWVAVAHYPAPPKFAKARMAHDPGRDHLLLGPGKYATAAGSRRDEQVFYLFTRDSITRLGGARMGTGYIEAERLLCSNATGVHVLEADWTTRRRERVDRWLELCGPAPDRPAAVALVSDGADGLFAVARGGGVYRFVATASGVAGAWHELCARDPVFAGRHGACVGYDRAGDRLVAWGGTTMDGQHLDQTLAFAQGAWHVLAAGSPCPTQKKRDPAASASLLYDTFLDQLLLFVGDHVAALQPGGWVCVETQDFDRAVDPRQRLIVHDPGSGETVAICLRERRAVRFDVEQCVVLADIAQAGAFVDLESADPARPWQADWVFDTVCQELILFVDDDLGECFVLDLAELLAHAANRDARTPLAERKTHILPDAIKAATQRAAHQAVADLPAGAVEKLIGLPTRLATPTMLRHLAKIVWRHNGADEVRAACAQDALDLDALGFAVEDVKSLFLDAFVDQVKS